MYASFKAFGGKAWSINGDTVLFDNKIQINLNQITDVRLQNTTNSKLINGVIIVMVGPMQYVLAFPFKQKAQGEQAYEYLRYNYGSEERRLNLQAQIEKDAVGLIYFINGVRGRSLKVYADRVVITVNAGIGSFITRNASDGEKTIYYADCIGLQFKESGIQIGYLQFETASRMMNNINSNFFSENSFTFDLTVTTNEQMKEVRDYVEAQIRMCKNNQNQVQNQSAAPAMSAAEEIKQFKELLDMGIISQEEFEAKKKQLLGL